MWPFGFPLLGRAVILRGMRCVRGVGAAAVAAVVLLVSGCGGGGPVTAGDPSPVAAVPETTEPVVEDTAVTYPATPEGDIDRLADEKGWVVDDLYESASAFVTDICESLPVSGVDGQSRPQWLAESGNLGGDGTAVLKVGVQKLCPKWDPTLKSALSGRYDRWFSDGDYEVKAKPGPADPESDVVEVAAGSYRTRGDLADCYWERTSQSGEIIANQLATQAREITVTVRAGELFTSQSCGTWKPVK